MRDDRPLASALYEQWRVGLISNDDIIGASVESEPWGFDCVRYEFKDGSYLIWDKLVKEWVL